MLNRLPDELLLTIADHLEYHSEVTSFKIAIRPFYNLDSYLKKRHNDFSKLYLQCFEKFAVYKNGEIHFKKTSIEQRSWALDHERRYINRTRRLPFSELIRAANLEQYLESSDSDSSSTHSDFYESD